MEEDDLLGAVAGGFVEDFCAAPDGGVDVDVSAGDVVFVGFGLGVFLEGAVEAVAEEFQEACGEMAVLGKFGLVALDADAFLDDVHALVSEFLVSWVGVGSNAVAVEVVEEVRRGKAYL